ncbi:hypothetical protein ACOSP7_032759 [Xanthoceras sorbifolium]
MKGKRFRLLHTHKMRVGKGCFSVGAVARDSGGSLIWAAAKCFQGSVEVEVTEAIAILEGLQPGAVYVSQSLHFRSPVYVGEEIAGEVQAINTRENNNRYIVKFSTKCVKNNCELIVLDGEAMAILLTLTTEQVSSMSTADRIEY